MSRQQNKARFGPEVHPGRGAVSNRDSRYHSETTHLFDDGWGTIDAAPPPLRTELETDHSKTIIARNHSPDLGFDRSINPYRGCEHGCIYCFARPTHAYLGLSPGLDFESRILIKPKAAALLKKVLDSPRYRVREIAMGTNTDPYQPIERQLQLTRSIIEILHQYRHPLGIVTKSFGVTRDIDLFADMAQRNLIKISVSITTLDGKLARTMEPRASAPHKRLQAIKLLAAAGVPTGVMTAPMIPGLNDHEMEDIMAEARSHGAGEAGYTVLRLPLEIKDLFDEWVTAHYPNHRGKIFSHLKSMHGGDIYRSEFGVRLRGSGPYAALLKKRHEIARRRLGFQTTPKVLDTTQFRRPETPDPQLQLF